MVAEERRSRVASASCVGQSFLVSLASTDAGGAAVLVGLQQCGRDAADGSSHRAGQTGQSKMKRPIRSFKAITLIREKLALLGVICLCASILSGNANTQTNEARADGLWSLKPVMRSALPKGTETNAIDRFINAELKERGIKAVGVADKLTLLRRVYLDLI